MIEQTQPYPLRMSADLRTALEDQAAINSRSLHSEILTRLSASLDSPPTVTIILDIRTNEQNRLGDIMAAAAQVRAAIPDYAQRVTISMIVNVDPVSNKSST